MKGYKGFDKDLKCKNFQYTIGEEFKTDFPRPKLCDKSGLHFCETLDQAMAWYSNDGKNRYCEVEALGEVVKESLKCATNHIKIIKEITREELDLILYNKKFNFDLIKTIQTKYPMVHIGGSTALFLHGVRLERFKQSGAGDIDLVCPYFILFEGDKDNNVEYFNGKKSGNDFDETFIWNGIGVDVKIDNKQRYEIINYEGFNYKVSTLETILAAKIKYSQNGQTKHRDDIYEICNKK